MKKIIFTYLFLFVSLFTFGTERTLFVDNFNSILGNPYQEDKLFAFAQKNNFNVLILYELNKINKRVNISDPNENNILATFIKKAKQKYQIKKLGASGEAADFFVNVIHVYNNSRKDPLEKFDIYNLEYEYWSKKASDTNGYYCENYLVDNGIPCGREGSFRFFIDNLKQLKELSKDKSHKLEIDAFVGYYTQKEITEISKYCDRLLVQSSGKNPAYCFNSSKRNLDYLSNINSKIRISILFSTTMSDLGFWLKFNSLDDNEQTYFKEMKKINGILFKKLNFESFTYHTYSYLEKSISYYSYNNH